MSTLSDRLRAHADVDFDGLFREAADELDRLTAELAKAKAMPMKYRRMEFNAQLQEENSRLTARVAELEKLVAAVASAPFPLHDYVTKEQWEEACHIYAALESKHE